LKILKRIVDENQRYKDKKLELALWEDHITYKSSIKSSPYVIVYEKRDILLSHINLLSLQLLKQYDINDSDPLHVRMFSLIYLDELRENSYI